MNENKGFWMIIGVICICIILTLVAVGLAFGNNQNEQSVTPTEDPVDNPFTFDEKTSTTYYIDYKAYFIPDDTKKYHVYQHTSYFDCDKREDAVKYIYQHHGWIQDMGLIIDYENVYDMASKYYTQYVIWIEYV